MLPQLGVVAIKTYSAFPLSEKSIFFKRRNSNGKVTSYILLTVQTPATAAAGQVGTPNINLCGFVFDAPIYIRALTVVCGRSAGSNFFFFLFVGVRVLGIHRINSQNNRRSSRVGTSLFSPDS